MENDALIRHVKISKYLLLLVILMTVGLYVWKFRSFPAGGPDAWGQFGDYLGGVMNPLIAFGAFYWLATSVLLQKSELSQTRKALEESHRAQQKQADIALVTAKIQAVNTLLSVVASKLIHLGNRQDRLANIQLGAQPDRVERDESGVFRKLTDQLCEVNQEIARSEEEQRVLLFHLQQYGLQLHTEVPM